MSSEDVLARRETLTYLDGKTPMALETAVTKPVRKRAPKLDQRARSSRTGYQRALRLAAAEHRKVLAAAKKLETAARKASEAAGLKQAKLDEAEGGRIELPAVVTRGGNVVHVDCETAVEILDTYLDALCLDCETSGYWIGHQYYELRTVQLGGEEMAVVLDPDDPMQRAVITWALNAAKKLHAHSATADVIPCVHAGFISWDDAWGKMEDSVLHVKLTDPKLSGSEADALKRLAHDLLQEHAVSPAAEAKKNELFKVMKCLAKTDVTTPPERNGWFRVSKFAKTMITYAGSDVLDLAAVLRVLPPLPVPRSVLERECAFQAICARSAYWGFPLDLPHIKKKIAEFTAQQKQAQYAVAALTGGAVTNPSSSSEVLKYLLEHGYDLKPDRKTKMPSAGKASLEPHAKRGDSLAKNIIEYRHSVTTLGLLLRPLENLCLQGDSIMRPTVYTINAVTGRCSCVRPNGQQFSRQGGIRACVRCWLAYRGISVDFAGCEIIVGAALSGDKQLYEAETGPRCHRCGEDSVNGSACLCGPGNAHQGLHWLTAHTAKGVDATKEDRYNAKRGTFTRLFGGGPSTAADQVGTEVKVMEELFEAFNQVAPVYTAWDQWLRNCFDAGSLAWRDYDTGTNYSQDIPGSRHLVYRAYSGRQIYVTRGAHAAGNGAIQGTARELLVDGTLLWAFSKWGHLPVLPIHDQLVGMVPEDEADEATAELARCMTTDVLSSPGFPVHIGVDTDKPFVSWPDSS